MYMAGIPKIDIFGHIHIGDGHLWNAPHDQLYSSIYLQKKHYIHPLLAAIHPYTMPRDEVDISAITNEPRKRTLSAYVRNQDNISGDRDQYVKRIKQTVNPGMFSNNSNILPWFYIQQLGTLLGLDSESVNHHDNTLSAEDDDPTSVSSPPIRLRKKGKKRTLESSEEDDDDEALPSSVQPQKKVRVSSEDTIRKNKKKKLTSQSKKSSKNHKKSASDDSDVELDRKSVV